MADTQNVNTPDNANVKDTRVNYGTTRVLKMSFYVNNGGTMTWNLKYPRTNLTKVEVINGVMNEMINDEAILYKNNEATEVKDAFIYETRTIEIGA